MLLFFVSFCAKQCDLQLGLSTLCFLVYLLFFPVILFYSPIIPEIIPKYLLEFCEPEFYKLKYNHLQA